MQVVGKALLMATINFANLECTVCRVGQNYIYTVHIRYFWQGNHQIYGHIRCIYTVLANPTLHTVDKLHLLADPDTTSAHARARSCPHPAYTLHTSHTRFSTGLTHPASSPTHTLHLLMQGRVAALIQSEPNAPSHTLHT